MDINLPIIMDNSNLRRDNPNIKEHFAECEKELADIPKNNGIIEDPGIVSYVNCPVCGSKKSKQWIVKWGCRYDECSLCSLIYLKNRFKSEFLSFLYKNSVADKLDRKVHLNDFNKKYWNAIYSKYIGHLTADYNENAKILDVGCGSGQFLKYCYDNGLVESYGIDIHEDIYQICQYNIPKSKLIMAGFEEKDFDDKFNLIFFWGVLEHLSEPNKVMEKLNQCLEFNGQVLILVPNIHSRARHILGVYTPTINPRQHLNFFTYKSIEYLCKENNFKIKHYGYELPIIDLMWPFIQNEKQLLEDIHLKKEGYYHIYILNRT